MCGNHILSPQAIIDVAMNTDTTESKFGYFFWIHHSDAVKRMLFNYCTSKSDCDERVAAFGALKRKRISKVPPSV